MAQIILGVAFVLATFGGMATGFSWLAVLTWRNPKQAPRTLSFLADFRLSERTAEGLVRGIAVLAAGYVFLALAIIAPLAIAPNTQRTSDLAKASIGCLAMAFLSWLTVIPIVCVNRPRFLVVPYLRDEPGSVTRWRNDRRALADLHSKRNTSDLRRDAEGSR